MNKLAVLGHPIGHTLSPVMHNASIQALGLADQYEYDKLDVAPDALLERLSRFPSEGYAGVNLTIPLKEVAFQGLEKLDESARTLGAVNTVEFTDDGPVGHNTDGYGVLKALEEAFGKTVENDSVFVLGCGGAGRAVALMAALNGAKTVTLADVDAERLANLAAEIAEKAPTVDISQCLEKAEQVEKCRAADLVIQASPVGMKKDDPSLMPPEAFREGQRVFDLIYMYPETTLLGVARKQGAQVANGLGMLLHQGARAFKIWTGIQPDVAAMRTALELAVYGDR
ncbi:shikimate dehydrogenase [Tichowtungia aerotolerans]|uniref:Shikimate dehydrogenase (NADP(+)) n=1 Tax=Tichowtungia aerotolerans TaxID=2697043 RepID=A0A6P1MDQ5_9BACT|nr:shikimate dehydrogenase [Tichowtungia aerotolerans]QHI70208.1 shikimate dehydrogenase [Tichowtungia aerotolerans]